MAENGLKKIKYDRLVWKICDGGVLPATEGKQNTIARMAGSVVGTGVVSILFEVNAWRFNCDDRRNGGNAA